MTKDKLIGIVMLCAAAVTLTSSVAYIFTKTMIPGLSAISLGVLMIGLVYTTRVQYAAGKITKNHYSLVLLLGSIGGAMNMIAGVTQIMAALAK